MRPKTGDRRQRESEVQSPKSKEEPGDTTLPVPLRTSDFGLRSAVSRREAVTLLAALPIAHALDFAPPEFARAVRGAEAARAAEAAGGAPYAPKFFNAHEWRTVRMLARRLRRRRRSRR